jgi:hypothetical protein
VKKAVALFITLLLVVSFSFISLQLLQTISFSNNIDKLKYYNLQTMIHIDRIKSHYQNYQNFDNFTLNDERYDLQIFKENNITHLYLQLKNEPIRRYLKF